MKFETIETIPCDVCGEEFLPHMLNTNSFGGQLTCEHCDAEIAKDMEQIHGGGYVADDRFYGDEG
tara:strand:- start:515 stop:709 length:195 start_codon:yes stop_codon:yes gene_type:complete